jgi:hypothetical protein
MFDWCENLADRVKTVSQRGRRDVIALWRTSPVTTDRRHCFYRKQLMTTLVRTPVRFIDASVDGLDLAAAGFTDVEPKETGRPGYAPADLLKLYICGHLNCLRPSRRLEVETLATSR